MSNAYMFVKVLDNQRPDEKDDRDWPALKWKEQPADDIEQGARKIVIPSLEVAFVFNSGGVLIGAVNYKQ